MNFDTYETKPVAFATRGDIVESFHRGTIAVVNSDGEVLKSVGDTSKVTYMRSAGKPMQAIPVFESGAIGQFGITEKESAIFTASHNGEPFHLEAVTSILKKAGLDEGFLQCGSHPSLNKGVEQARLEAGLPLSAINCNCSGKHSGVLAACKHLGYSVDDYYRREHPFQKLILKAVAETTQLSENSITLGTDGCGLPVYGLPVEAMARGYANMMTEGKFPEKREYAMYTIRKAMQHFPEMVGGTDRLCSDLMRTAGGKLFSKVGAEGVYIIGIEGKDMGIAVKIEDGNWERAMGPVVVEVLKDLGVLNHEELKELEGHHHPQIKNFKEDVIGEIVPRIEWD